MKNPCAFSSLKKKSEVWRSILGFGVQTGVCLAHCQYQAKGEGEGGTIIQKWRECSLYLLGVKKRMFSLTKSRVGVFAVPLRVLDQKRIDRKQCVLCCFSHGNRTGPWYFLAEYQAFLTPDLLLRKAWYSLRLHLVRDRRKNKCAEKFQLLLTMRKPPVRSLRTTRAIILSPHNLYSGLSSQGQVNQAWSSMSN